MSPDVIITISITNSAATTGVESPDVSGASFAVDIAPPPDVDEQDQVVPAPPQVDPGPKEAAVGHIPPPELEPDEDVTHAVPEEPPA